MYAGAHCVLCVTPTTQDLAPEGDLYPWMRLLWLIHPVTPNVDLTDDDEECAMVARLLLAAAVQVFPALAAVSEKLAVAQLLAVRLPFQLVHVDVTLNARVEYVQLLAAWHGADPDRRVLMVQERFQRCLRHFPSLAAWVDGTSSAYQSAADLHRAFHGGAAVLGIEGLKRLESALADDKVASVWSDGRSAAENVQYLVKDLTKRRGGASSSTADGHAPGPAFSSSLGALGEYAVQLASLDRRLVEHYSADTADDYGAMEIIFQSEAVPAIRWLLDVKGVTLDVLPASFADLCTGLPAKKDEYVVDSIKHDDTGGPDPALEGLAVSAFYVHSAKDLKAQRAFFLRLYAGHLSAIDWEKDFVHRIAAFQDPDARAARSMQEVYADAERCGDHVLYVGRVLHCLGKTTDAAYSYANVVQYWTPALREARKAGTALKQDAVMQIDTLMKAVWISAAQVMNGSISSGTRWMASLCQHDGSFQAFDSWAGDMKMVGTLGRRFPNATRALQVPLDGRPPKKPKPTDVRPGAEPRMTDTRLVVHEPRAPPTVGERAQAVVHDGTWSRHSEVSNDHYHVENCRALAATMGYPDQCILVVTSKSQSVEAAARYCEEHHTADAPQHALWHKQDDFVRAMAEADDGKEYHKLVINKPSGRDRSPRLDGRGRGGGRGKDRARGGAAFRGRAARQ